MRKRSTPSHNPFLSTLSLRRATYIGSNIPNFTSISIHALLAESDHAEPAEQAQRLISIHALLAESDVNIRNHGDNGSRNFYPRSPCGERQTAYFSLACRIEFLSTLSLRRATTVSARDRPEEKFLSTLSLRRATLIFAFWMAPSRLFLSTLSLRRAT